MTDPFAVQATTTKRTDGHNAGSAVAQWRWHKVKYYRASIVWGDAAGPSFSANISASLKQCIDELYAELRRRNAHVSGEGAGGGLLFDDVMKHFVTCTDEACLLATTKSAAS